MKKKEIVTPEYTRRAIENYRKKFDIVSDRLPAGAVERMKAVGMTPADRADAIIKELERRENEIKRG